MTNNIIIGKPIIIPNSNTTGGGVDNLPPTVSNLTAEGGNQEIHITWTNPNTSILAGVLVVYSMTHYPNSPTDGKTYDAEMNNDITLTGLENDIIYYIRVFPYNVNKQYQTIIDNSTVQAMTGASPAQVTNVTMTGSENITLNWTNPTEDALYHQTVVVQKENFKPLSITDGLEIFRGTETTVTTDLLDQSKDYYFAIFTISSTGTYKNPIVLSHKAGSFPTKPTDWLPLQTFNTSGTFTVPETGWFKIIGLAASGGGGTRGYYYTWKDNPEHISQSAPGGGGAGGIVVSEYPLVAGTTINITISGQVTISCLNQTMTAKSGGIGGNGVNGAGGLGGEGGIAEGGNIANQTGATGGAGRYDFHELASSLGQTNGGAAVTNTYDIYNTRSGKGYYIYRSPTGNYDGQFSDYQGMPAKVVILRGDTNNTIPTDTSNSSDITVS